MPPKGVKRVTGVQTTIGKKVITHRSADDDRLPARPHPERPIKDHHVGSKSDICRYWLNGHCYHGDRCKYQHSTDGIDIGPQPIRPEDIMGMRLNEDKQITEAEYWTRVTTFSELRATSQWKMLFKDGIIFSGSELPFDPYRRLEELMEDGKVVSDIDGMLNSARHAYAGMSTEDEEGMIPIHSMNTQELIDFLKYDSTQIHRSEFRKQVQRQIQGMSTGSGAASSTRGPTRPKAPPPAALCTPIGAVSDRVRGSVKKSRDA